MNQIYVTLDQNQDDYTEKFHHIEPDIMISNVGSSHGLYGFCYDELSEYKSFNFALSSQSLKYDYNILLEYKEYLADDGILFIPISYFSLYGKNEVEESDFVSKNNRYYKILSKDKIKNYEFINSVYAKYIPLLNAQENIFRVFLGQSKDRREEGWNKVVNKMDLKENVQAAYGRHFVTNKQDENGNRILNQESMDAIYDIIDLCKEKNIRPILITTPYLKEYTDLVSDDFLMDFHGIMEEIQQNTKVEYYDYSHDERFTVSYDYFLDGDHLNKTGAMYFVSILKDEVIKTK